MRKPLVAGNWKMNGLKASVTNLINSLKQDQSLYSALDVVIIPTFAHLTLAQEMIRDTNLSLGAQNLYPGDHGAFTGEVSGLMLEDLGCKYVLVGHSERRALFNEDPHLVASKFQAALNFRLQPILCIGETLRQREKNETEKVIKDQLETVIKKAGISAFRQAIIAYEPVWAIGTGLTATPEQAQQVHIFIRNLLSEHDVDIGQTIRILYGGSLKADNAPELFAMPDIDGGLVGGASLEAMSFSGICKAALRVKIGQKVA